MPQTSKSTGTPITELIYLMAENLYLQFFPNVFSSAPTQCFNLGQCFIQEKEEDEGRFLYMPLRLPSHYSKNIRTLAIK